MKKLHRAALSVALVIVASPLPGQRPSHHRAMPIALDGPPDELPALYAGSIALAVGGLGLMARAKRR